MPSRPPASARPLPPVHLLSDAFRRVALTVGCLAVLLAPSLTRAQTPGEQDTSFVSILSGATLFALTLQDINGTTRIFAAGDTAADARELTDGNYDTTFSIEPSFGNATGRIIYTAVQELVLQDAGAAATSSPKVLLGGLFGRSTAQISANQPAQNIVRIDLDGTVDTTFNPGKGSDNYIVAILPLPDGGMVVGGEFVLFNNLTHEHIVRLDNTGAIVPTSVFDSSLAFDATVLSLATQVNPDAAGPQGQILVAGTFSNVNGRSYPKLARLNADGSVDTSFHPNFSDRVRVVTCQPDGKILAGGDFESVNGVAVKHIVRLNYDGSVDPTFVTRVTTMPPLIAAPVAVNVITPLGDGRYYIGGNFAEINGVKRGYLGRVNADGTVDSFDPGNVIINAVQQVAADPFTNLVYVTETRSKSITTGSSSGTSIYPPTLIRLFGDPVPATDVIVTTPLDTATKNGANGEFLFTRVAQDIRQPLTAYVTLGGNANLKTAPMDKTGKFKFVPALKGATGIDGKSAFVVTFPADVATVSVGVHATNSLGSRTRRVSLTVQPDPTGTAVYNAGSTATVTLVQ